MIQQELILVTRYNLKRINDILFLLLTCDEEDVAAVGGVGVATEDGGQGARHLGEVCRHGPVLQHSQHPLLFGMYIGCHETKTKI
jgi:hypothetical protein